MNDEHSSLFGKLMVSMHTCPISANRCCSDQYNFCLENYFPCYT